jgi:hypothetical protein
MWITRLFKDEFHKLDIITILVKKQGLFLRILYLKIKYFILNFMTEIINSIGHF